MILFILFIFFVSAITVLLVICFALRKPSTPLDTEQFKSQIQEEIIVELRGLKAAQHFTNRLFSKASADLFLTHDSLYFMIHQSSMMTGPVHLPVRITRLLIPCKRLLVKSMNMDAYGGHISIKFASISHQQAPSQIQIWGVTDEQKQLIRQSLGGTLNTEGLFAY